MFRRAPRKGAADDAPDLLSLMEQAGERALRSGGPALRDHVTHMLVTTMPHTEDASFEDAVNLPTRLKTRLQLPDRAQARFEIGSSDAGAAVFSSAVHLLRGLEHTGTALVVAGQTMWGGADAVRTVARVVDEGERQLGVNMLAVGDLLLDRFLTAWRRDHGGAGDIPAEVARAMIDELVLRKLELGREYQAAQRPRAGGDRPEGSPWITPWLRVFHVAPASVGACAVVLTSNIGVVREWLRTGAGRVVRVLGVGEGDTALRLTRRAEPLGFHKSIRQALQSVCEESGTNLDYLRSSAFAVLHDAFPSIEMAFLQTLGFSPFEASQRALTYWPNPYGGLTAFGHALGASGLVQVAKAFHIFLHQDRYFDKNADSTLHVDLSGSTEPLHCLTTSVGGPLTHVVATLLESVPKERIGSFLSVRPADPTIRFRHRMGSLELDLSQDRSVVATADAYRRALCAHVPRDGDGPRGLGVLEARTRLDVRHIALPIAASFLDHWSPGSLRFEHGLLEVPGELGDRQRALMGSPPKVDGVLDRAAYQAACSALVKEFIPSIARRVAETDGTPDSEIDARASDSRLHRTVRNTIWDALRVPVALVSRDRATAEDPPRALCLLAGPCAEAPVGSILELEGAGVPVATRIRGDLVGLAPPWTLALDEEGVADGPVLSARAHVESLVHRLNAAPLDHAALEDAHWVSIAVAEALQSRPATPPPLAARALFHELVWRSAPDRWRLEAALSRLVDPPVTAPTEPQGARMGYCEFDVVNARSLPPDRLVEVLEAIVRSVRRGEAWFGGARLTFNRLRDMVAVTIEDQRLQADDRWMWPLLARFTRDVYQHCMDQGHPIRAACGIDFGAPFELVEGRRSGTGRVQLATHLALQRSEFRHRGSDPSRNDGVAIVLPGDDPRVTEALADRIWDEAGGERISALPLEDACFELGGQRWFVQLRRRARTQGRGPTVPPVPTTG